MLSPKAMDILDRLTSAITKIANDGLDIRIHGAGHARESHGHHACGPGVDSMNESMKTSADVFQGTPAGKKPDPKPVATSRSYAKSYTVEDEEDWATEETEGTPVDPPAPVDIPDPEPIPMGEMTINELKAEIKKLGAKRLPQSKDREWYLQKLEGMKKGDDQDIPPDAPQKIITGEEAKVVVMQYHGLKIEGSTGHDLIFDVTKHKKLKEINELPDGDYKNGLFRKLYNAAVAGLASAGVKV